MTIEADILRWMSQAYDEDSRGKRGKKKEKKKWKMEIKSWLGFPRKGEWVREAIATTLERTFERHTHGKGSSKKNPINIVKAVITELVYVHDGYRPKMDGEKATRKAFYWRGARIWRG